jgi:MFS family permease
MRIPPLLPITLVSFVGFVTMGLALPVLPLHVHDALGMSPTIVGVVAGSQFAAALLSRIWAGALTDRKGAKLSMQAGLLAIAGGGALYHASLLFLPSPNSSVVVLILARLLVGCAESFLVTGALTWGVLLLGPQRAGMVMAWVGVAIYGGYAAAAPLGVALFGYDGFGALATATILLPLAGVLGLLPMTAVAPLAVKRLPFYKVLGAVVMPGLGLALIGAGLSSITAFIALLFAERGWPGTSLVFTIFGLSFILARIFFSPLPDRIGGAKVALICAAIEGAGLLMIWPAPGPLVVYIGTGLVGFGYSLAFPGFGVEAVRRAPPQSRGTAMGAYVAFLDISLGVMGPLLGVVASHLGIGTVYLAAAALVFASLPIAIRLLRP